ncbi:MAG: hypothetical protein KF729_00740 [Sandaracinaceae bacterium]|nr:hypothetical protein [Sandaracinaceae bacterium]
MAAWGVAGSAGADTGVVVDGMCVDLDPAITSQCAAAGTTCRVLDMDGRCRRIEDDFYCLPEASLTCCDDATDCPRAVGGSLGRCAALPDLDLRICLDPVRTYCADDPSAATVRACHTREGRLVPWVEGDCDGDGVPNGIEVARDTDPCVAPTPRGVHVPGTQDCAPLTITCILDQRCELPSGREGLCARTADRTGLECVPAEPERELFCGGPEFVCPDGLREVRDEAAMRAFCAPNYCPHIDGPLPPACIREPGGRELTAPGHGDCDGDGVENRDDESPCGGEVPGPDGGVGADAAVVGPDGGVTPGLDGGEGPPPGGDPPGFGGGGGCVCRAAPARSASGGLLPLLLAALALSRRASRRARRPPRAS